VPPAFWERSAIYFNPQPADGNAYAYKDPGAPENYCWLLAGEIRARAESLGLPIDPLENQEMTQASPADQAKSFLDSLSNALPDSLAGLAVCYDSVKLDQKKLCDLLFKDPTRRHALQLSSNTLPANGSSSRRSLRLAFGQARCTAAIPANRRSPTFPRLCDMRAYLHRWLRSLPKSHHPKSNLLTLPRQ
jgi:hypothetical protein